MAKRHQVIIVGGGPVGVALALALGLYGVRTVLIERRVGLQNIPKGQNLTSRTLEHFHFWGIAKTLRAQRILPMGYPISGIAAYGNLMSPYWYAPPQREIVRPFYYEDVERLPQYVMERVLRARLDGVRSVETRFGWAATQVTQDAESVRVAIAEEGGGGHEVLEADFAVGCDGGHSLVREACEIARGGADFDQVMVLAVLRSRELHEGLKRFPERSTYNALHPDLKGYWQFFGRIDVGEGWFFHAPVPPGTRREDYDFRRLLYRAAGFEFACDFDHVGFWDLRIAVAERYRHRRVFIAGDAAHSHPPYGGFGLNNGLEDAVNLAWKLWARLEGWGGDALLTSYDEERRPVFRDTGDDFIAARIAGDRAFLERYSPERDRAEFEAAWRDRLAPAGEFVRSYEPNYEGSPVVWGPPGGRSGAHGKHLSEARAGHHLAPQPLSTGGNVFEALGRGFALLAFGADDGSVETIGTAAGALGMPLTVIRDSFAAGREAYGARLVLVRPDQYVAWTGDRAPGDAHALLARTLGRAETQEPG